MRRLATLVQVEDGVSVLATALTHQPEPSAPVLNQPSCYHFRVFDPRLPLSDCRLPCGIQAKPQPAARTRQVRKTGRVTELKI